jgi:hypothetical protein
VDEDLHEKLSSIRRTLDSPEAELRVTYEVAPGVEDTVLLKPPAGEHRLVARELHDLRTALNQLRVQFFSQGELSRLSKPGQKSQVLRLIDASCGMALTDLANRAPVATSNSSTCGRVKFLHPGRAGTSDFSRVWWVRQACRRRKSFPRRRARGACHAHERAARWETRFVGTTSALAA